MKKVIYLAIASLLIAGHFCAPAMAADEEISLTTAASSIYATSYEPTKTLDGDYHTYWLSAANSFPCWIVFDAGEAKDIGRVNITWYSQYYAPLDYNIETSHDGYTWKPVATGLAGVYSIDGEEKEINRSARYIRLYIKDAAYYGIVREFEAYRKLSLPRTIRFQGSLGDAYGAPLDGEFSVVFKLYDAETGGNLLWEETQPVSLETGLLDVELGSVMPIDLPFDEQYWLGVTVGSDTEMTPRFKLTAVPYAIRSDE